MIEVVLATDAHARAIRIGDQTENMRSLRPGLIGSGDGLQRNRAHAQDEIVGTSRHLPGNCVCRADVVLCIETPRGDAPAIRITPRSQSLQSTPHTLLQHLRRSMLDERNTDRPSLLKVRFPRTTIRREEHSRGQQDQKDSQGQTSGGFKHGATGEGLLRSRASKVAHKRPPPACGRLPHRTRLRRHTITYASKKKKRVSALEMGVLRKS